MRVAHQGSLDIDFSGWSEIVFRLYSLYNILYSDRYGAIAQLIERFHGMEEVQGLSPCSSTIFLCYNEDKEGLKNQAIIF